MDKFAERLFQTREARGLSQTGLARLTDTTQQAISMYEDGKRRPRGSALIKLAFALKVNPAYLSGESDDQTYDERLPDDWLDVVQWAMVQGYRPGDIKRSLRALREFLTAENPQE